MRFYKFLCIVCLVLLLSFCAKKSPEWTESDELLWKQSSNSPSPGVYMQQENKKRAVEIVEAEIASNKAIDNEKKANKPVLLLLDVPNNEEIEAGTKVISKPDIKKNEVNENLIKEIDVIDDITKQEVVPVKMTEALVPLTIMDYPADSYTVQLLASVDLESVIRFAKKQHVSTKFLVTTNKNGKIWYVLLLDVYENYDSAVLARDEVTGIVKNKPWIRKVGSVQKIIKK